MSGSSVPVDGIADALTLDDIARLARPRLTRPVWDFISGGAGEERTVEANRSAFERVTLRPRSLAGAGRPDTTVKILGREWAAPLGIAPVAYHTLAHADGESATVRAAADAGVPVVVSTFAGSPFEELPPTTAPLWLQVYLFRDRAITRDLIRRAERAGFEALVLTADTPHLGRRLRDVRNGFRLPPGIRPANLPGTGFDSPADHGREALDPEVDWSAVEWLRSVSDLPLLVKGVMSAEDALQACAAGVDGLVVSNHGGRQLDSAPATLDVLDEVVQAVAGTRPVLVDGGVRRGTDVLTALALGADAALIGRPVLHGLAAAGQDGVARTLDVLREELTDAMALTGTRTVADARKVRVDLDGRAGRGHRHEPARPAAPSAPPAAARPGSPGEPGVLARKDLHASVSDPLLDSMNFLNEITDRYPQAVSFAPGRPFEGFFDTGDILTAIQRYLTDLAERGVPPERIRNSLYQYGPAAGQIRELIAASLRADEDIDVAPESIVVTVGAQEAMVLVLRALFSQPDQVLLVSSPCYVGITGAAALLDIAIAEVEEDENGFSCEEFEATVRREIAAGRRPTAVYLVPEHSNPSGNSLSGPDRRRLLELAERHDVLVIEDSPYRRVSRGPQQPALKALDHRRRVIHLGSYAKTVFPGARVGFVVADQSVRDDDGRGTGLLAAELAKIKSMITVNTPPLSQAAVAGVLIASGGRLSQANVRAAEHYGESLDAILHELSRVFPAGERERLGVRWNTPTGGFFLTVKVGFRADDAALSRSAEHFGVLWTPMSYFYPGGGGTDTLRLAFSYLTPAQIKEGIARLGRFVEAETLRHGPAPAAAPSDEEGSPA
ncbi:aminotransferase class I/II-fold pyridoxal phosphate-dependent enzyme [Streptomyces sp. NPDC001288]|uniref:aminotransferase class I/II-fold pyridoxal phosphate-dependent enzyme n=1 Tax=Streptomyces sp. NPDC001297 TaxID=3364559 RepID=UPI003685FFB2